MLGFHCKASYSGDGGESGWHCNNVQIDTMGRTPVKDLTPTVLLFISTLALMAACCLVTGVQAEGYDSELFRTYFGCATCDLSACKPPMGDCQLVKEPGICGCCPVCARGPGESCGIYTAKCADGLSCNPPDNAVTGIESLFLGKGSCGLSPESKYVVEQKRTRMEQFRRVWPARFSRSTA